MKDDFLSQALRFFLGEESVLNITFFLQLYIFAIVRANLLCDPTFFIFIYKIK